MKIIQFFVLLNLIWKQVFTKNLLIAKEWFTPPYTGWGNGKTIKCAGQLIEANKEVLLLNGSNRIVTKTFTNIPEHFRVQIRIDFIIIDEWYGDEIKFEVDSNKIAQYSYSTTGQNLFPLSICGTSTKDRFERAEYTFDHSANTLTFTATSIDSKPAGLIDLQIYVDTCHESCKSCSGSESNQCISCKTGATINSGKCVCSAGKYMWQGSCQNDCTGNLRKTSSGFQCEEILCKKANCATCGTDNYSCIKCQGRYKIYLGDCIESCPSYAENVGGVCQDLTTKYWNGYYLFKGFFESDFSNFSYDSYGFSMNQISAKESEVPDSNWAQYSDCQDQTGWKRFYGGFGIYGSKVEISKTFKIVDENNKPIKHSSVLIKFYYAQVENYEVIKDTTIIEYVGVFINGDKKQQLVGGGTEMGCGRLDQGENFGWIEANSTNTNGTNELKLEIKNNLVDAAWYEGFGLREMVIIVSRCIDNCDKCGDYDGCVQCSAGYYLWRAQCYKDKCPDGSFQVTPSTINVCDDCHPTCLSCNGGNANQCLKCQDPRLFKSNSCLLDCGLGFYPDKPTCKECHKECYACVGPSNNQCTKCTGNRYYYKLTSSCILNCPDTFYGNLSINTCDPCNSKCLTCEGPSENQCLTCPAPISFFYKKKCESQCPPGMYGEKSNQTCQNCVNPCVTCKNTPKTCTSCTTGLFLDINQCNPSCPDRFFGNQASQVCEKCHTQCAKCKGPNTDNCLSCDDDDGFFDKNTNKCVGQCPSKYFATKNPDPICQECDTTCTECNGGNKNNCTRCSNQRYLTYNSECEKECPDHYFKDTSNFICRNCHKSCLSCFNDSSTGCLSCEKKSYLSQNRCLARCPDQTYADDNKSLCIECHPSCASCNGDLFNNCTRCQLGKYLQDKTCSEKCKDGYYPDPVSGVCLLCHQKCGSCTDSLETSCLSCKSSMYLSNNECLSKCPDGKFHNSMSSICELCPYTCKTCLGVTNDQCLSCSGNRFLVKPGLKCESYCPQGTFPNLKTNECDLCDWSCKNCSGKEKNQCIECPSGTFLSKNECTGLCPIGNFPTEQPNLCNNCHFTCKTCTGSLESQCESCQGDRYFLPHRCMTECPEKYFGDQVTNTCQKCDSSCSSCIGINNNQCTKCYDDKILLNHTCVDSCPDGYVASLDKAECLLCGSTCGTCASGNVNMCLSCLQKWYMHENKCFQICPEGTFESSKTELNVNGIAHEILICKNCIENCLACSGQIEMECTKWKPIAEKKTTDKLIFYIFIGKSMFCAVTFFLGFYLDYLKTKPKKQKVADNKIHPDENAQMIQDVNQVNEDDNQSQKSPQKRMSQSNLQPSLVNLNLDNDQTHQNGNSPVGSRSNFDTDNRSPSPTRTKNKGFTLLRQSTYNNKMLKINGSIKKRTDQEIKDLIAPQGGFADYQINGPDSRSQGDVTNMEQSQLGRNTKIINNFNQMNPNQTNYSTVRTPNKRSTNLKGYYDPFTNTFNQFPDEDQRKYLPDKSFFRFFIIYFEITSLFFYYNKNLIRPIRLLMYYCKLLFLFWITSRMLSLVIPAIFACLIGLYILAISIEKIVLILATTVQKTVAIIFTVFVLIILYDVVWFFAPELRQISFSEDYVWSINYLITFGADVAIFQIIYLCLQYLYTKKNIFRDPKKQTKMAKILTFFLFKEKYAIWIKEKDE